MKKIVVVDIGISNLLHKKLPRILWGRGNHYKQKIIENSDKLVSE